jgi:hypothetical protein
MKMRDPAGSLQSYEQFFERNNWLMEGRAEIFANGDLERQSDYSYKHFRLSMEGVLHSYGRGDPLNEVQELVRAQTSLLVDDVHFLESVTPEGIKTGYLIDCTWRRDASFVGLALLLVESPDYLLALRKLISPDPVSHAFLTDALVKAFIPNNPLAKKYKTDKYSAVWMEPIQRALALPADERAYALAMHMKNWCRIMRPWGWKPNLKPVYGGDNLFCDFAFEVALAVCAYDIDDSTFKDHPYYPRDLVEHYRTTIRHKRDAWRAHGAGAGVPIVAPPLPKKADLSKSKRKAVARWIELVCDGDIDAIETVLETIGKPRKVEDISELMESLAESSQAIQADSKDDETTLLQAAQLAEQRALGDFDGPPGPPFGPARCRAGLLAFAHWLQPRGYRLVDLDNDDDAWHVVVVKTDYHAELLALSDSLKIRAREADAVYND